MKTKVCFKCKGKGFHMTNEQYLKVLEHNGITKQMLRDTMAQTDRYKKLKLITLIAPIVDKLRKEHGCKLCHTSGFLHYPNF